MDALDLAFRLQPDRCLEPDHPNVGSSKWVIDPAGNATEFGLGNAKGTATLTTTPAGSVLTIRWQTSGWEGFYEWQLDEHCHGRDGKLVFTAGPRAGQVETVSTVQGPQQPGLSD